VENFGDSKKSGPIVCFFKSIDYFHLSIICILSFIGIVFIYGIGQQIGGKIQNYWKIQCVWVCLGFLAWIFFSFIFDLKKLRLLTPLIYFLSIGLLLAVLIQGQEINAAKRWLSIAGFRFQPSEFAKIAFILILAWVLSVRNFDINKISCLFITGIIAFVPFFLICIEPDMGTASIIIPVFIFIIFAAKLNWKWILSIFAAFCVLVPAAYPFLKDYQKERILVFLDADRDPKNRGWNSLQAQLAVGSGGIAGKGFMKGTQYTLGFLPQTVSSTDFIFSVIGEETGFVGSASLVICYFLLCASILRTAAIAPDPFARYLATGAAALVFFHSFVNIGMTIRLMPITGVPLPFISYGGTVTTVFFSLMGMVNSINYNRKKKS
jgi:rod shape determining protein RodA